MLVILSNSQGDGIKPVAIHLAQAELILPTQFLVNRVPQRDLVPHQYV
jgi:hypothetical protein